VLPRDGADGVPSIPRSKENTASEATCRRGGRRYATTKKIQVTSGTRVVYDEVPGVDTPIPNGSKRKRVPRTSHNQVGHSTTSSLPREAPVLSAGVTYETDGLEQSHPTGGSAEGLPTDMPNAYNQGPCTSVHSKTSEAGAGQKRRIAKLTTGLTRKRGCQYFFVAKQLYVDQSLYEIQHHSWDHSNPSGQLAHGSSFEGFRHSFGAHLSSKTRRWIENSL
jgi:hypothetical protein